MGRFSFSQPCEFGMTQHLAARRLRASKILFEVENHATLPNLNPEPLAQSLKRFARSRKAIQDIARITTKLSEMQIQRKVRSYSGLTACRIPKHAIPKTATGPVTAACCVIEERGPDFKIICPQRSAHSAEAESPIAMYSPYMKES